MHTLYEVLGLPGSASEDAIKASYRALARQLHPDVNGGNEACAGRLKEVNEAYGTLGSPDARAAYDADLARQRAEARRRTWAFAGTTVATFVVTMTVVSLAVRWHLEARASRAALPEVKVITPQAVPQSRAEPAALPERTRAANWATYRNARYGFALRYPAGVFALDLGHSDDKVHTFVSRDGRAVLRILAAENTARMTLADVRSSLMKQRYAGASFDQTPRRDHWFALAGRRGESVFLERITFSCDGKAMHGWQMTYPASERATYDPLAKLVLRNHPHGNGPGGPCSEEEPRSKARRTSR